MSDFLHNLRNKPSAVRERIAIGTTAVITVLIIGIWLGTNKVLTFSTPEETSPQVVSAPGPLDTLKNSFSKFSDNFTQNVDDLTKKFDTQSGLGVPPATSTDETEQIESSY